MSDIALYYPYVHPRDDGWLKHAVLYWPVIERIVPGGYVLTDTHTGQVLKDAKILVEREPQLAIAEVAGVFANFVRERAAELEGQYSLGAARQLPEQRPWNDEQLDLRLGWIHRGKITKNAVDTLCGTGLAVSQEDGFWIGMHPALSEVYMCALTAELAAAGRNTPITDHALHHVASTGWTFEDLSHALLPAVELPVAADAAPTAHERVVSLALGSFALRNLADVPVERVIALREKHGEEFRHFRGQIDELVRSLTDLDNLTDPQALAHHIDQRYRDTVEADLSELKRELREQRFEIVDTAMSVSVVAPTGLFAGLVAAVVSPVVATVGATALATWKAGRAVRERRAAVRTHHSSSWLLRIEEQLRPHGLAAELRRLADRFAG